MQQHIQKSLCQVCVSSASLPSTEHSQFQLSRDKQLKRTEWLRTKKKKSWTVVVPITQMNKLIYYYFPFWDNSQYFSVSHPRDPTTFKWFAPSYRKRLCQIQKLGLDIKGLVSVKLSSHFPFVITSTHFIQLQLTNTVIKGTTKALTEGP